MALRITNNSNVKFYFPYHLLINTKKIGGEMIMSRRIKFDDKNESIYFQYKHYFYIDIFNK